MYCKKIAGNAYHIFSLSQLSFCLWVLAYNSDLAAKLNKFGVIPILADILTDAQKEKVSRIILAVFRSGHWLTVSLLINDPGL